MTYWRLFYHLVWGTKDRIDLIDDQRGEVMRKAFAAVSTDQDVLIHSIGWMPNHVHLAVSIPPKIAVAEFAQNLKGASSFRINQAGGNAFKWQPGYGVVSFNERLLPTVITYIGNQRTHHAEATLIPSLERLSLTEDPEKPRRQS